MYALAIGQPTLCRWRQCGDSMRHSAIPRALASGSLCMRFYGNANALTPDVTITTYCFPLRPM